MLFNNTQKLLAVTLALVLVAGMTSPAFAGGPPGITPVSIAEILEKGESTIVITTISDPTGDLFEASLDSSACTTGFNDNIALSQVAINAPFTWQLQIDVDENASEKTYTCNVVWTLTLVDSAMHERTETLIQQISITVPSIVAGELLSIDPVALVVAGLGSMIWMVPAVSGVVGAGVILVKFRANKE
ncbi:MAG TPA: hypothetical protein VMW55_08530 [Nitrosopumilaceae archaeon]|nr:hypothetical protein [Nitrosopumilaceae archaeon]